jgi:hypothetical protein
MRGGAERPHLPDAAHGRQLDARGAGLEEPVDGASIDLGNAHHGRQPERVGVPDKAQRVSLAELRVLAVDDHEVEAGGGRNVDDLHRGKLDEQAPASVAPSQHM